MSEKTKKQIIDEFLKSKPPYLKYFVKHSMELAFSILSTLKDRKMSQAELADLMNKEESQISKWLSGTHNFTIKTLTAIGYNLGKKLKISFEDLDESEQKKSISVASQENSDPANYEKLTAA